MSASEPGTPPASTPRHGGPAVPADGLIDPIALAAVLLLLINDHVLKQIWPGVVTGKLSDVAGLAFFPLVPLGVWEIGLSLAGRWRGPRARPVIVAAALTGVAFVLVKTTAAGATAFGWAISFGQWLPAALAGLVTGHASQMGQPAAVVRDATDLIALPALLLAVYAGLRRPRA